MPMTAGSAMTLPFVASASPQTPPANAKLPRLSLSAARIVSKSVSVTKNVSQLSVVK